MRRIPLGLGVLLIFLLAVAWIPDEAVLRTKVVWGRGLMLLAAAVTLIEQSARGRLSIHWPRFLLVAFLPGLMALVWLTRPSLLSRSLAMDEIQRLLLVPVAFWTVSSCLPSPRARRILLATLVLAVVPVSAYAVAQKLAGTLDLPIHVVSRAASTFGNPVFLAAFLVLTTPFCAAAVLFGEGPLRWLAAVATGLALPALLASESRWALAGLGVSLATGIVLLAPSARLRRRLLVGLLVAGALLAAASTRILLRPQGHSLIWRDTLAMIASHPWGVGPGQFHVAFLPYASPELLEIYPRSTTIINDAHCEPLQVAADLGWQGLGVMLGALALLMIAARRTLQGVPPDDAGRPWLVASLAALAGSLAQSLGSPDLRFMVSTLLFATAAGFAASFAPARVLAIPAGRIGRAALIAIGLIGIWGAASSTHDRLQIASLIRPPAPFQPSAAGAARIDDLRLAVLDLPDDAELHYQLGVALATERHYGAAAESFRDAARLSQGLLPAVRSLGIVESLSGQYSQSLPHLRAVLDAEPGDTAVRYLVAYSAYGLGDVATSIAELETLLASAPDHPQARLLLEKLRE